MPINDPQSAEDLIERAHLDILRHEPDEARRLLGMALDMDPGNADAARMMADIEATQAPIRPAPNLVAPSFGVPFAQSPTFDAPRPYGPRRSMPQLVFGWLCCIALAWESGWKPLFAGLHKGFHENTTYWHVFTPRHSIYVVRQYDSIWPPLGIAALCLGMSVYALMSIGGRIAERKQAKFIP
jgi:hypothetical protein